MSFIARIRETGQVVPIHRSSDMSEVKLVIQVQPGQHIDIYYQPDAEVSGGPYPRSDNVKWTTVEGGSSPFFPSDPDDEDEDDEDEP
jgi:hypothetical protein